MKRILLPTFTFTLLTLVPVAQAQRIVIHPDAEDLLKAKEVSIDPLFGSAEVWASTAATLEETWKDKGFKWNSEKSKDSAIIRRENWGFGQLKITAFEGAQSVEEVIFILKAGKLAEVSLAVWNKGDSQDAELSERKFTALVEDWTTALNRVVAPKFETPGKDTASAAKAERRRWIGKNLLAQLEFSGGKEKVRDPYTGRERTGKNFQGEFIRLRLLPKPDGKSWVDVSTGGKAVRTSELAKSVVREPAGEVFIPNIPMEDQGDKGYCAVATASRVLKYYGIPTDQHEMAQISGNDAGGGGTNPDEMESAMRKISGKYKTRFVTVLDLDYSSRKYQSFMRKYNSAAKKLGEKILDTDNYIYFMGGLNPEVLREVNGKGLPLEKFMAVVRENIDKGIPVMWALQLGLFPENGEEAKQSGGGHMRLIIGYNLAKKEIIFSDSWGAGHEKKTIAAPDASAATMGLYLLQPAT